MARRTFGFTSGLSENLSGNLSNIYHVRDTELNQGRDRDAFLKNTKLNPSVKKPIKLVQCMIKFLDNSNYTFEVDVSFELLLLFMLINLTRSIFLSRSPLEKRQRSSITRSGIQAS